MITKKTVFVLGAGASKPYGFPSASEMIDLLCEHETSYLRRDKFFQETLEIPLHPSFVEPQIQNFRTDLRSSALESIDAFLTARPEYAEIGRAAIAATLVPLEDREKAFARRDRQWYGHLRNRMGETYKDFCTSAENLSIVTFNYDRSFEYFFLDALTGSSDRTRAIDAIKKIKIIHVYGQLGKPDFLTDDGKGRPFDPTLTAEVVKKCISEIRVIPENQEGSSEFDEASSLIEKAEVVYFLGFGYNPVNVKRLKLSKHGRTFYGTAFDLKPDERRRAEELFVIHAPGGRGFPGIELGQENEDTFLYLRTYHVVD